MRSWEGSRRRSAAVLIASAFLALALLPATVQAAGAGATPSSPVECPPAGSPGYPTYPGYPGYPTYPGYPGYPGYPSYPGYPGYPGYPPYPPYPPYPCPPEQPPPEVEPGTPRIDGPDNVTVRVDRHGRFVLGRVIVRCPATPRLTCSVTVLQVADRRIRIRPLRFTIPAGRASRIRLQLALASLRRLIRRHQARAAVDVSARQANGPVVTKRVRIHLLAPRRERVVHARRRALTGRAVPDRRLLGSVPAATAGERATGAGLVAGISDQQPATFADARFRALGMRTARLVVPYDAMRTEPATVAAWMGAATAAGIDPLVAFDHAAGTRCPAAPCSLPSTADYAAGVGALLAAYPNVHLVTPWNEANHAAEPTAGRPDRAAAYYDAARAVCPSCTLVAGDVIDGPGMVGWLRAYRAALDEAPTVWGLHDYYDTTYFRTSGLEDMLATVSGDVWLTETGGIVQLRNRAGAVTLPHDEGRARASVSLAIETARAFAGRVKRIYVYQWRAGPSDSFDAGLVRPDGRARPALRVVEQQLGAPPGGAPVAVPGVGAAGNGATDRAAVPGRLVVRPDGRGTIRLRCSGRSARCAGRLWLEDAAFAGAMLVNGRPPDDVLAPVARRFSLRAGHAASLRFRLPTPVLRRAQAQRALRLRLAVTSPAAPFALQARYLAVARPAHTDP